MTVSFLEGCFEFFDVFCGGWGRRDRRTPPCGVNRKVEPREGVRGRQEGGISRRRAGTNHNYARLGYVYSRLALYVYHSVGICTTTLCSRIERPVETLQVPTERQT